MRASGIIALGIGDDEMDLIDKLEALRQEMFTAAENLEFEKAAKIRDRIRALKGGGDGEETA